jgi:hypothetical protein
MKIKNIPEQSKKLSNLVDRFSKPVRAGARESHDLESLSRRMLAPVDACQEFRSRGMLTPVSTLTRGGEGGPWIFESDELNDLRKFVLAEVVAKVIDESDGDENRIRLAASHALGQHRAQHCQRSATEKEFSARVSAGGVVMFDRNGRDDDEGPGLLRTAATSAAGDQGRSDGGFAYGTNIPTCGPGIHVTPTSKYQVGRAPATEQHHHTVARGIDDSTHTSAGRF